MLTSPSLEDPAACLISNSNWSLGFSSRSSIRSGTVNAAPPCPLAMMLLVLVAAVVPLVAVGAATSGRSSTFSPRRRACVACAAALIFLYGAVLGTTSSRNSRLSWCETALASMCQSACKATRYHLTRSRCIYVPTSLYWMFLRGFLSSFACVFDSSARCCKNIS